MTAPPPGEIVSFVTSETYEDGCQKSTWRNFHENGHQHVCVCGEYSPHEGVSIREGLRAMAEKPVTAPPLGEREKWYVGVCEHGYLKYNDDGRDDCRDFKMIELIPAAAPPPGEIVLHRDRLNNEPWYECESIEPDTTYFEHLTVVPAAALAEAKQESQKLARVVVQQEEELAALETTLAEATKEFVTCLSGHSHTSRRDGEQCDRDWHKWDDELAEARKEIEDLEEHGVPSARVLALEAERDRLQMELGKPKEEKK